MVTPAIKPTSPLWSLQAPDSLAKSVGLCDVYVNPKALDDAEIVFSKRGLAQAESLSSLSELSFELSLSSSLLGKSLAEKGSAGNSDPWLTRSLRENPSRIRTSESNDSLKAKLAYAKWLV